MPIFVLLKSFILFGSPRGTKYNMAFYQPQGDYFLEKYDGLPESVAFAQKITDKNGPKVGEGADENKFFENFRKQK